MRTQCRSMAQVSLWSKCSPSLDWSTCEMRYWFHVIIRGYQSVSHIINPAMGFIDGHLIDRWWRKRIRGSEFHLLSVTNYFAQTSVMWYQLSFIESTMVISVIGQVSCQKQKGFWKRRRGRFSEVAAQQLKTRKITEPSNLLGQTHVTHGPPSLVDSAKSGSVITNFRGF